MRCATVVVKVGAWLSGGGGGCKSPLYHEQAFPFPSSALTLSLTSKPKPVVTSIKPHPPALVFAVNDKNKEVREEEEEEEEEEEGSNGEDVNEKKEQQRRAPVLLSLLNWKSLLDPDPDNVLALGLTGLLTWASVQVLWQLLFISFAIFVAALKYSFIAALLLFILIALL